MSPRPAKMNPALGALPPDIERTVSLLDARWQARNRNQVDAINRLLMDSSYDHEMELLHTKLAHEQAVLRRVKEQVACLGPGSAPEDLHGAVAEIKKLLR